MFKKIQHIYFVGIGGIGMSGIAQVLLNLGYKVSGSDVKKSETINHLAELGANIFLSHQEGNITGIDVLVTSSAIRADNPEVMASHRNNIPVIPRAEMLAELMRLKYGIAVAGTHGKTSTTSMIAHVLAKGNMDPTTVIGGRLDTAGSNARLGKGDFLLAEADESDGSFLKLSPTIAVVTNIDEDHLDYYSDLQHIQKCFLEFVNKVPFYGAAILCMDQKNIQPLLPYLERKSVTYGILGQADLVAEDIHMHQLNVQYNLVRHGKKVCRVTLSVPGTHNLYNSLAAFAVGLELEIEPELISKALGEFRGVQRRFQVIGDVDGVKIIDDYAHHPTEVKATLKAAKRGWNSRTIVIFQPHRYSRTKSLLQDFATSFYEADILFVTDIYPAGESPIAGMTSETLVNEIRKYGHRDVHCVSDEGELLEEIVNIVSPGDMVFTLGAGNIGSIAHGIFKKLKAAKNIVT